MQEREGWEVVQEVATVVAVVVGFDGVGTVAAVTQKILWAAHAGPVIRLSPSLEVGRRWSGEIQVKERFVGLRLVLAGLSIPVRFQSLVPYTPRLNKHGRESEIPKKVVKV